jgi:tRNA (guanine-N7-)-methyltransferase
VDARHKAGHDKVVVMSPEPTMRDTSLRSYGRRKARPLSERKSKLIETLLPVLRLPLGASAPSPLQALFAEPVTEVWLEIGFGSGEHLIWQAEHHPDVGLIGCEPFINGVSSLLGQVEASGIKTIRVHDGDAREVLDWLPDASLGRVFLLFPDPWPKKRHQKRRLLTAETVGQLARALKPGGLFRFASDDGDYAGEALRLTLADGAFAWTAERASDWRRRPSDWPETRYERKALSAVRKPAYLNFRRL